MLLPWLISVPVTTIYDAFVLLFLMKKEDLVSLYFTMGCNVLTFSLRGHEFLLYERRVRETCSPVSET